MSSTGKLIILSGPSGVGKSTVLGRIVSARDDIVESISATSRAPRGSEKNEVDYFFMSPAEFKQGIEEKKFAEWAEVFGGNFYGTPIKALKQNLEAGKSVIMDIDVQGAKQLRRKFPSALQIFLLPPSWEELRERVVSRGTDTLDAINERMARAKEECECSTRYSKSIINEVLEETVIEVLNVIDEHLVE